LPSGKSETGVWDATINVGISGLQEQTAGVVSFPVPLNEALTKEVEAVYLTELLSENPIEAAEKGCPGNPNNPEALPGKLCIFTGGFFGSQEKGWVNAKFFKLAEPNGEFSTFTGVKGDLILFRTGEFAEPPAAALKIAKAASMNTGGSWAVTAP
jgi:hypothetical protein